jgi:DNA-binding FadR family transcriptional regulator
MNRRYTATIPIPLRAAAAGDGETLRRLFDARKLIEAAMARQAAKTINKPHLAKLREALEANRQAIGNRSLFKQTDIDFHRVLFLISGNPVFNSVHAAGVSWLLERWRHIDIDEVTEELAFHGHAKIIDAIAQGDPDSAERAMNQHLSASWTIWAGQLQRH